MRKIGGSEAKVVKKTFVISGLQNSMRFDPGLLVRKNFSFILRIPKIFEILTPLPECVHAVNGPLIACACTVIVYRTYDLQAENRWPYHIFFLDFMARVTRN